MLLEFRVSVFGVKTLGITFLVVPVNGGSRVIPLLKAFDGVGTSSRVKTQDLTMLVSPDNDGVYAPFPSLRHCFWRSIFGVEGSSTLVGLLLLHGAVCLDEIFVLSLSCSLLLAVCILVVQRPGMDTIVCIILM